MRPLSILQFAKNECGNYNKDGSCLGVRVEDLVDRIGLWYNRAGEQEKYLVPQKECLLHGKDRCNYFEQIVLPLAGHRSPIGERGLQLRRQSARDTYLASRGMRQGKAKERFCKCGVPLEKQQRFCSKCSKAKRKESSREAQRKKRMPVSS